VYKGSATCTTSARATCQMADPQHVMSCADDVGPLGGALAGGAVADDNTAAQPAALAQAAARAAG